MYIIDCVDMESLNYIFIMYKYIELRIILCTITFEVLAHACYCLAWLGLSNVSTTNKNKTLITPIM